MSHPPRGSETADADPLSPEWSARTLAAAEDLQELADWVQQHLELTPPTSVPTSSTTSTPSASTPTSSAATPTTVADATDAPSSPGRESASGPGTTHADHAAHAARPTLRLAGGEPDAEQDDADGHSAPRLDLWLFHYKLRLELDHHRPPPLHPVAPASRGDLATSLGLSLESGPARGVAEAVLLGNLPGMAGPWLTQYGQRLAQQDGTVAILHLAADTADLELIEPTTRPPSPPPPLHCPVMQISGAIPGALPGAGVGAGAGVGRR